MPGGFGGRGIEGKIRAVQVARERKIPYLGICLGMQVAVSEFARNVAGMPGANSTEFDIETEYPVIDLLPEQKEVTDLGGTMRLGADPIKLHPDTRARELYDEAVVYERHRHRYEVSISLRKRLEAAGLVVSGTSPDERLVEVIELRDHPFFVASQFHPEFKSRPERPAPLFREFVAAALERAREPRARGRRGPRLAAARREAPALRPASEVERRRLNDLFAELCAIPSPFGREARDGRPGARTSCARSATRSRRTTRRPRPARECGNLLARIPGRGRSARVMLCAHLDTVPHEGVGRAGAGRRRLGERGRHDPRRRQQGGRGDAAGARAPRGGRGLAGRRRAALLGQRGERRWTAPRPSTSRRCAADLGFVFDHATPIGEVVVASPTFYRLHAAFRGAAAHAGIRPEAGRSAIVAAAKAIAAMPHGRIDDETTANVGTIAGGVGGTNVVAEHCWFDAEARSLSDAAVEAVVAEMVDRCHDAANDPACECDVDVTVERVFTRLPPPDHGARRGRRRGGAAGVQLHARGASSAAAARTPTRSRPTACTASTSPTAPSATTSRPSASARSPWRACST